MTRASAAAGVVTSTHTVVAATGSAFVGAFLIVDLAIAVIGIVAAVKVVTKAGYSGWWVLILLVPVVGFIMTLVFAFSDWPVLRELKTLRAQSRNAALYGSPYAYGGGEGPWGTSYVDTAQGPGPGFGYPPSTGGWSEGAASDPLPPFGETRPSAGQHEGQPGTGSGGGATPSGPSAGEGAATQSSGQAPPGWYPTPDGRLRYWDGAAWTEHFA